jgi:hypothetical protein
VQVNKERVQAFVIRAVGNVYQVYPAIRVRELVKERLSLVLRVYLFRLAIETDYVAVARRVPPFEIGDLKRRFLVDPLRSIISHGE